ncbi:hypothetical protein PRUPE_2G059100 [Prunus persica]|uniref:Uncharacterized protein n=1 Tax=Prunus persica TaxID=3760 RepID=A0A251QC24_PRUPE|nr:hypothetical protein PRUPE_2G059100 [Prunus persica]
MTIKAWYGWLHIVVCNFVRRHRNLLSTHLLDLFMESIDNIVSGFHNTLAILESEEVEVVKVEELEELHAEPFLMNEFDKRKIMQESPWNFDRALLLFGAKYGWVDPIILPLDSPCFWVERIGNFLGTCIAVGCGLNGDCLGCFLRIRVNLKITEPLKRHVTLRLAPDEPGKQY